MKVLEIITESPRQRIGQRIAGLFFGMSRKEVVEKLAQQWARDIENALARGVPPRLSNPGSTIPERFRGDATILSDARSAANRLVAGQVGSKMFTAWNQLSPWMTAIGMGDAFYDLVVGLYEDAGKYQGEDFQQAAQVRIDRFVGQAMAVLSAPILAKVLKLPTGFQSWFGWVPGVTKLTNLVASLTPTANIAVQSWLLTDQGKRAVAEFYAYNSLGNFALQPLRAWLGGYMKETTQVLIDKIQDLKDPQGAAGRQGERNQRDAAIQARDANNELKWEPTKDPRNKLLSKKDLAPSN